MNIMAFESSCDETSVAIVNAFGTVLTNIVATQIDTHAAFGGVFPEVASRLHTEQISLVIKESLQASNLSFDDIDAIAVTQGPGLAGSLHIGMIAAKTIAFALDLPLIPVHHLAGHIYANQLVGTLEYPLISLVISGGHTELVYMKDEFDFEIIGTTHDDAVGEAYDKVARQMGLSYPGGPIIDKMAQQGQHQYDLPKVNTENPLDFSFSGIKSAVRQTILREERLGNALNRENLAYDFQMAAVSQLLDRTRLAVEQFQPKMLLLAGGVSANSEVRKQMSETFEIPVLMPPLWACMDQAAMIGLAGHIAFKKGYKAGFDLSINPSMDLTTY